MLICVYTHTCTKFETKFNAQLAVEHKLNEVSYFKTSSENDFEITPLKTFSYVSSLRIYNSCNC